MPRIILTAVDENEHYHRTLKVCLKSLFKYNNECVWVALINCTKEFIAEISSLHENIKTIRVERPEESAFQKNYIRHDMILGAFDHYNQVLWLDNDTIIRGPLTHLWVNWNEVFLEKTGFMKIWVRPKKKDAYKYQTGIYLLGRSEPVVEYVKEIQSELKGKDDWMLPQILIYDLFQKYKSIKLFDLTEKYNDSRFRKCSVIWHSKHNHFKDPKFQKEFKVYEQG